MPFRVGRNASVDGQIKALADAARKLGISSLYTDALLRIHGELENRPLEWGEPEYSSAQPTE